MDKLDIQESRSTRIDNVMNKPNPNQNDMTNSGKKKKARKDSFNNDKDKSSENKSDKDKANENSNGNNNDSKKRNKFLGRWSMDKLSLFENILLTLYIFPPFGIIICALYEVYWIMTDVIVAFKCFIQGNIMIIDEESEYRSFKRYRKIVEMWGER